MWAKILVFFGLSSCVVPPVEGDLVVIRKDSPDDEMAVFFIGNSYSFGVPAALKKVAKSHGKKIRVGHSTHSGWCLSQHMEHASTLKKLRGRNWDVVVIQDYSLNPGKHEKNRRRTMDPGVQFFAAEARLIGAIPMLYQTWGRRDGEPGVKGDDFFKMNARVREGYRQASERGGGIIIIPAGDGWEQEYRAGRGAELYVEDGSHPSEFGNEVTARVFYETIFKD